MRQSVWSHGVRSLLVALGLLLGVSGLCQGFNIDLDIFTGPPNTGNGAPSSAFGAAAGQPGFWNRLSLSGGSHKLRDLADKPSGATMTITTTGKGFGGIGFLFEGNSGDHALLLNDAAQVGTLIQGGDLTYSFRGLTEGLYEVYTYAVNVAGFVIDTPVLIPQGDEPRVQVVTGPMPGNSFEYLITHSKHRVTISTSGYFQVIFEQPPAEKTNQCVNGFQIASVPEAGTGAALSAFLAFMFVKRLGIGK